MPPRRSSSTGCVHKVSTWPVHGPRNRSWTNRPSKDCSPKSNAAHSVPTARSNRDGNPPDRPSRRMPAAATTLPSAPDWPSGQLRSGRAATRATWHCPARSTAETTPAGGKAPTTRRANGSDPCPQRLHEHVGAPGARRPDRAARDRKATSTPRLSNVHNIARRLPGQTDSGVRPRKGLAPSWSPSPLAHPHSAAASGSIPHLPAARSGAHVGARPRAGRQPAI